LREAEAEGWSVARLRQEIAKRRPKRNRETVRSLANTLTRLKAFLAERREHLFNPNGFRRLDRDTVQAIRQTLNSLRQELERIEKQLGRIVQSRRQSQRP
jgi:vacuolar-type H+-ATPase subunit I/STV1